MEYKALLGIISALLVLISYSFYIRDILRGKSIPHVFTWGLWSLIIFIIFILQLSKGAGLGALSTLFVSILCFVVLVISLIKEKNKNIRKIDVIFLLITLLSIPLWLIAKSPTLSTVLLLFVYSMAGEATIRKSWVNPNSETLILWIINAIRAFVAMLALSSYNFVTLAFPLLVFLSAIGFSLLLIIRRKNSKV